MNEPTLTGLDRVVAVFRAQENARQIRNLERLPAVQARRRAALENRAANMELSISIPFECFSPEEFEALPQ